MSVGIDQHFSSPGFRERSRPPAGV
jgi:hypothetical protein